MKAGLGLYSQQINAWLQTWDKGSICKLVPPVLDLCFSLQWIISIIEDYDILIISLFETKPQERMK